LKVEGYPILLALIFPAEEVLLKVVRNQKDEECFIAGDKFKGMDRNTMLRVLLQS
jgi:hypothetical protein